VGVVLAEQQEKAKEEKGGVRKILFLGLLKQSRIFIFT